MNVLPWIFLALGAGLIARAIVPKTDRATTTWIEVILIGASGAIFGALLRQQVFGRVDYADAWALLFSIAGAVVFACAQRLVKRRSQKRAQTLKTGARRAA
jgi:uncharacterized membrane protein YeaQ/YmgE (transglycosylase-associated protein family)